MNLTNHPAAKSEIRFVSYGVHIGVHLETPELVPLVQQCLPPGWRPSPRPVLDRWYSIQFDPARGYAGGRPNYSLHADTQAVALGHSLGDVLQAFAADVRLSVAERTRQRVFVHAGVVGWCGRAIVIPGRSYTGKTTLVMALVRAGALYFSDEYAVLDRHGRVYPYARPLSIRDGPTEAQTDYPVETLGGVAATHPLEVGLVLISHYEAGAVWMPLERTAADGVLALADNSIAIRRSPQRVLPALTRAVSQAEVLQGARGDACQVVSFIINHFSQW